MSKKKGIIGFKGVALGEVTEDTITSYKSSAAVGIPYAGSMTRTAKESSQDFYYDDDLYAQLKNYTGDDVEIRFAEIELKQAAELGLGEYDEATNTLEANFNISGKTYALGCVADTVDGVPFYFKWRAFDLNGIRFDSFKTKGSDATVCEVIMTGVLRKPRLASAKPYVIRGAADDKNDLEACDAWLKAAETLPKA